MQSSIALLAALIVFSLIFWPARNQKKREKHVQAIVMADIEFQKNQCYFAGAIQIASLVLSNHLFDPYFGPSRQQPDAVDARFLLALSTNGYVPVILNLVIITNHGRQSWYLLLLSLSIFALSTGTLTWLSRFWANESMYDDPDDINSSWNGICENYDIGDLSNAWCGRDFANPSYMRIFENRGWLWAIWAICLCWLLYCVACKLVGMVELTRRKVKKDMQSHPWISKLAWAKEKFRSRIWGRLGMGLFVVTWSLSFCYQFYLYSVVFSNAEVDTTWSFGQIVAITIWAPCLVEYLNLELSEYPTAPYATSDTRPVLLRTGNIANRECRWYIEGIRVQLSRSSETHCR